MQVTSYTCFYKLVLITMETVIAAHAMLNFQLECSVCYQMFNDPRILPCGHTFCLKCLQDIVTAAASKTNIIPSCPTCSAAFQVGSQNLQDLLKNFTAAQLISALPANSQCVNNSQHGPAQHVCLDCWDALCDTCSSTHTQTKFTKNHAVKLLSEVTTEDIQAHKAKQTEYCQAHPDQEVAFYCDSDTCQRFVCLMCTGVKCRTHTCLELGEAENNFNLKINKILTPLQELSNKFDSMIKNTSSAIKILSANYDTVQHDISTLLSDAEVKLQSLFDKLLTAIKQCRDTANLTVSKSHSEQMDKLHTSLADKHEHSHDIKQHVASVEHHLTPSSSVFDRSKFVRDKLPDIESETRQAKTDVSAYLHTNISKWKTDMTAWLDNISDALTTATTQLPQLTEHSLVTHSVLPEGQVTSAKHKRNFTVEQIKDDKYSVTVLSVSRDGQLLVGQLEDSQLHVYSGEGSHVTSINLLDGDTLYDAVWTLRGHIVFTAFNNNNIVVMTQRGDVIALTKTLFPARLSISTDGVIYVADRQTGVYQSTDDGVTWIHVFKVADGWQCVQVIRVSSDSNTQVFWTNEVLIADSNKWRLRVYTVDKQQVGDSVTNTVSKRKVNYLMWRHVTPSPFLTNKTQHDKLDNVTWRDVNLPSHVSFNLQFCTCAFDGYTNMFVLDHYNKAVHVWSASGQFVCQLVSSQQLVNSPQFVAVDSHRGHVMYVGQFYGTVGVFELT